MFYFNLLLIYRLLMLLIEFVFKYSLKLIEGRLQKRLYQSREKALETLINCLQTFISFYLLSLRQFNDSCLDAIRTVMQFMSQLKIIERFVIKKYIVKSNI